MWRIGGEELSWTSQERASAQIDFSHPGAIQINGFAVGDNILQLLEWDDGLPPDFVSEQDLARIWDNVPLRQSNLPLVDGKPATSSGNRFKTFGASQAGTAFFLDLGARFPVNRIVFFPRQEGQDEGGRSYQDDFIRGYEILANNGLDFNEQERPIYNLITRVDFTLDSIAEILFPLQFMRYIRLSVVTRNPFELAEIQVYGTGFAPKGQYLSEVVDLGEPANYNRLAWTAENLRLEAENFVPQPDADAQAILQMRTGADDTPYLFYEITNPFTRERQQVSESVYNSLAGSSRGPIEDDQISWSRWSSPFTASGDTIGLPSPRRYFQFQVLMESHAILDGMRLTSLAVEHAIPPLAQQILGEISLPGDPYPEREVPVVRASEPTTFVLDIITDISSGDLGFDGIKISTPSQPRFKELLIGAGQETVEPDSVAETSDALILFFPSHRVESPASGILRVVFDTRVFVQSTIFEAEAFDTRSGELPQKVSPGDANPAVGTNTLRVLTSVRSIEEVLPFMKVTPPVISPNGDGINDKAQITFSLVQLLRSADVRVEVFDLGGRRVRTAFSAPVGSGMYTEVWDGRDDAGRLLPVGIFVVVVSVQTEQGESVQKGTVKIAY